MDYPLPSAIFKVSLCFYDYVWDKLHEWGTSYCVDLNLHWECHSSTGTVNVCWDLFQIGSRPQMNYLHLGKNTLHLWVADPTVLQNSTWRNCHDDLQIPPGNLKKQEEKRLVFPLLHASIIIGVIHVCSVVCQLFKYWNTDYMSQTWSYCFHGYLLPLLLDSHMFALLVCLRKKEWSRPAQMTYLITLHTTMEGSGGPVTTRRTQAP